MRPLAGNDHSHRFLLDAPNGPVTVGRCACGEVREYAATLPRNTGAYQRGKPTTDAPPPTVVSRRKSFTTYRDA